MLAEVSWRLRYSLEQAFMRTLLADRPKSD
jgi:hypothetical protein